MQTPVDLVFNIAEGVAGRNREAAVPALCELMGIPYTGSDAATLSIALDKALSKRVLLQHGILTRRVPGDGDGRESCLSAKLKFPLIVKPNQEGSSKGVSASASVVDDEAALRAVGARADRALPAAGADRGVHPGARVHGGPAGRSAAARAAADGDLFKDKSNTRPVYDFQIKQEWEKHVSYQCPAQLSPAELKARRARLPRDLRGARLPRRRARRPAHDAEGRDLRHRGEPAAGADARATRTCA